MRGIVVSGLGGIALWASVCPSAALAKETARGPQIAFAPVLQAASPPAQPVNDDSDLAEKSGDQISAIVITGNEAIDDAIFQPALTDLFGEEITDERLAELSNEVTQLAKDEGYAYARTTIEGVDNRFGIIEVSLDEGVVSAVEITGYENALAKRILNRLVGKPVRKTDLERALLLVSDIPVVRLKGARFKREEGQGVLNVTLSKRDPRFAINGDNYGSEAFGPIRVRGSVTASDLVNAGDEVRAAVRINPVDLGELLFLSAAYEAQIGTDGVTLSATGSVGTTAPGGAFEDIDITGLSARLGGAVSVPIIRTKKASLWADARVNYIAVTQDNIDTLLRDDTVVTAAIGLRTQFAIPGGRLRAGIAHVRGLDLFGATRLGDPLASRLDGDGVFSKVQFWSDARFGLNDRIDLFLALGGQMADRPLLGSEELALGGAYRTRGYNFSEVLGDEGIYGLAELRYKVPTGQLPLDRLQFYAFFDGGLVNDIARDTGEGSLFSAGPGVRARMGVIDIELEGGFPLGGSGERRDDGPQVNMRAGLTF